MKKKNWGVLLIILLFVILVFILIIISNYLSKGEAKSTSFPYLIRLNLSISNAPALGETAEITATVKSVGEIIENISAVANITLPEGFELVSGNSIWQGEYKELESGVEFNIVIKAIKIGNWTIEGNARAPPTGEGFIFWKDAIYISIMEDETIIRDTPFPEPPCVNRYINGELVRCITTEPTGDFVETER